MNKVFRIYIVVITLYFIAWVLQVMGHAVINVNKPDDTIPPYLYIEFMVMITGAIVLGIWAAIYNRKYILEGIKSFINNKN